MDLDRLIKAVPSPIKSVLKIMGIGRLLPYLWDKSSLELSFQREWAKKFRENKDKVLEYWRKYRYLDDIETICKIKDKTRVLDVGCGISTILHYVKGKRYGIDPLADEYLKLYKYPPEINIQKGSGESIPFPDRSFDVVFCSNVLDHVEDPDKTVEEIFRVLKEKGYLILLVEIFDYKQQHDPAHPHSLSRDGISRLIREKFKVVFEKEVPRIGLSRYVNGIRTGDSRELIMVLAK